MEITVKITKHRKKENAEYVFLSAGREIVTDTDIEAEVLRTYIEYHNIDTDTDEWTYEAAIDEIKI